MFNSFSKFSAISQDKFYSPLFADKSQAFAPNSRFIINPDDKTSVLTPANNTKSFTPFSKPNKLENSISCLTTSSQNDSHITSSNDLSLQSPFINSYFNSKPNQNVFDRLKPLSQLNNLPNMSFGKIRERKISQNDINKDINENFEEDTFNMYSLKNTEQILNNEKIKKRIRLIKKDIGLNKLTKDLNFLNKKRGIFSFKDSADYEYSQLCEPVRPKPRKNIVLINDFANSDSSSAVIHKKKRKNRDPNMPKGRPGRKPKYEYMKNMKICVGKLFFQLFSSSLNKIPAFSFNRRSVNRINKYIHYQDIIKEEPINFSNYFNELKVENQQQNYKLLQTIKNKSTSASCKSELTTTVNSFNSLNFIDQIQNISIDLLNPTISSLNLSYLLKDIKNINLIIKNTPIIKINEYKQSSFLQLLDKPEVKVKKFIPFVVINPFNKDQKVIKSNESIKPEVINEKDIEQAKEVVSIPAPSINMSRISNKIFIVKHNVSVSMDDSSVSEFDSFGEEQDNEGEVEGEQDLQSDMKNHDKSEKEEVECKLCGKIFSSTCALGGHMSKKHANSSEKYKAKIEVRKRREDIRELIMRARELFCEKFSLNFEKLYKTKEGREKIRKLIKKKYYIYKDCIKECKRK